MLPLKHGLLEGQSVTYIMLQNRCAQFQENTHYLSYQDQYFITYRNVTSF
jgi:hypothetical protein